MSLVEMLCCDIPEGALFYGETRLREEELRPVLADRFVPTAVNNQITQPADFVREDSGSVRMTDEGRRKFLKAWQERKKERITHPFLQEKMPWGLALYVQALLLARLLRVDLDAYPLLLWK